jgi:hypothetical protein
VPYFPRNRGIKLQDIAETPVDLDAKVRHGRIAFQRRDACFRNRLPHAQETRDGLLIGGHVQGIPKSNVVHRWPPGAKPPIVAGAGRADMERGLLFQARS